MGLGKPPLFDRSITPAITTTLPAGRAETPNSRRDARNHTVTGPLPLHRATGNVPAWRVGEHQAPPPLPHGLFWDTHHTLRPLPISRNDFHNGEPPALLSSTSACQPRGALEHTALYCLEYDSVPTISRNNTHSPRLGIRRQASPLTLRTPIPRLSNGS